MKQKSSFVKSDGSTMCLMLHFQYSQYYYVSYTQALKIMIDDYKKAYVRRMKRTMILPTLLIVSFILKEVLVTVIYLQFSSRANVSNDILKHCMEYVFH